MMIGNFELGMQELSIGLMIFFALVAMFFMGYKLAYSKAVDYANKEILANTQGNEINKLLTGQDYNISKINIELPTVET